MSALGKKMLRDLARMWGQALTIALVVASGIAMLVAMQAAYDSLRGAREQYYADRRFADVFVTVERTPQTLIDRIENIPGVARAYTRIVEDVLVPIDARSEPAIGRIVGVPTIGEPPLNALHLRAGRWVEPGRLEVMVLEGFADAYGLKPGDSLPIVLNGRRREARISGIALSPEFIFAVAPGSFVQDDRRFTVLWADREDIAAAFAMEAGFNDLLLSLEPGASEADVIETIKRLLEPYGLLQAVGRKHQLSHRMLDGELAQLRQFSLVAPLIFLTVAAVLVNIVLARMLQLERGQIATLKAVGYGKQRIALHYVTLAAVMVSAGAVLGVFLGDLLGRGMLGLYRPFFRFATLEYHLSPRIVAIGVSISALSGIGGALGSVLRSAAIPPAEAMQPEAPPSYHASLAERLRLWRGLSPTARMVARELSRRPLRTALSCGAIALAAGVVGSAHSTYDVVGVLLEAQFEIAQREEVEVVLRRPRSKSVVHEARSLPGAIEVQAHRMIPARVRFDQRERDIALIAFADTDAPLRRPSFWPSQKFAPAERGVAVSTKLASILGAKVGDRARFEALEGDRPMFDAPITALIDDTFGLFAYTSQAEAARLLGDEGNVSSLLLRVEPGKNEALLERLNEMPAMGAVNRRSEVLARLEQQIAHNWVTAAILTFFGAVIAFGVVYNNARIALSMRSRDFASLRVLGFTRGEISRMLLGELVFYLAVGLPLGTALVKGFVALIVGTIDAEAYRMPIYVSLETYLFGAAVTVAAGLASALFVRRKLDRLDLIAVLKTRE